MVASFTALQLFSAYSFENVTVLNSANSHFTVSYNISLYHDTKAAIYRYTQIMYHYTSNVYLFLLNFQFLSQSPAHL